MPSMMQARFGEDTYPIGRFVLDRARALGMGRTELVRRLCYHDISNGHKALTGLLITGTAPPLIAKYLAPALEVGQDLIDAVLLATARQQHDEAKGQILARENAYRAAFRPHLRCETLRTVPQPIFVAALIGTARLRLVAIPESGDACTDQRDRLIKRAIRNHYRDQRGHVPAFGTIVSYTFVVTPGYLVDFGLPYDIQGDPAGPMISVARLGEASLGIKRGDTRLTGLLRNSPIDTIRVNG
jgi:hypothetical protein